MPDDALVPAKTFGKRSQSMAPMKQASALLGQQSIQFLQGKGSELHLPEDPSRERLEVFKSRQAAALGANLPSSKNLLEKMTGQFESLRQLNKENSNKTKTN